MSLTKYFVTLCAIAKDETPFLEEWVAYHHYIGFEKIYIYDNESKIPISETLSSYCDAGICEVCTIYGLEQQNIAYNHCIVHNGQDSEWMAFFDIDEFLCLKTEEDIRVLLQDYNDYSGLSVQWDQFSSSGHILRPKGFVTLNYTESLGESYFCKCFIRPKNFKYTYSAHHFEFTNGFSVNPNYEITLGGYSKIATDKICLNHYFYRSQYDYAEKLSKTDATYGKHNTRTWKQFFESIKAPKKIHTDIIPSAKEVYSIFKDKKVVQQKYSLYLYDVHEHSLSHILKFLVLSINNKNQNFAEVLYAECSFLFANKEEFLQFGIALSISQHKYQRAKRIAKQLFNITKNYEEYYMTLFECELALQDTYQSNELYVLLSKYATVQKNTKMADAITRLLKKYPNTICDKLS